MKRKPYPKYRDSSVEWLGDIPLAWSVRPLKQITSYVARGNGPDYADESDIRVINQACVYWGGIRLENVKFHKQADISSWRSLLQNGDLLMNSTGTGTLGRCSVFDEDGTYMADSHVTIIRTKRPQAHPRFCFYLLQTPLYQGYVYAALVSGSTNQIELSREKLRSTPFIVPSLEEQQSIVAFLDHETAKVDAMIAKKERLITLLEEKRKALISHAVTKGLNSDAPMKDSGIEWLGAIPSGWCIKPLKQVTACVSRGDAPDYVDESNVKVINQACVYWDGLRLENVKFQKQQDISSWKSMLKSGDVLMNSTGTGTLGRCAVFSTNGDRTYVADGHVTIIRTEWRELNPYFCGSSQESVH